MERRKALAIATQKDLWTLFWRGFAMLVLILAVGFMPVKKAVAAYDEVQIVNTPKAVNILYCPPGLGNNAGQSAFLNNYPSGGPVTLQEALGTIVGAGIGAATGYYVIGGKTATIGGAIAGGAAGYALSRPNQNVTVDTSRCTEQPGYQVNFRRVKDGLTGTVITKSYPTGRNMLIQFCPGPTQGDLERPC